MSSGSREGPRIKIQRAKRHIYELEAEIEQFRKSSPFTVVAKDEPDTGDKVWRVKVHKRPPPRLSAIIGDAVHNLRSSLDLLVNQLVIANGCHPSDRTAFPIGSTAQGFQANAPQLTKGVSDAVKCVIEELKPYRGGNDDLWRLHRLDIADKHRLLMTVGAAHRNVIIAPPASFAASIGMDPSGMPSIAIAPADIQFPLDDGAEIFRVLKAAREGPDDLEPKFTLDVAFGDGEVVTGEPVLAALWNLAGVVEQLVCRFDHLLPNSD